MYRAKKKKNSVVTEWDLKPIELVDEEIEKPVIILNETTPNEIIARSYELGASEYIEKPYNRNNKDTNFKYNTIIWKRMYK